MTTRHPQYDSHRRGFPIGSAQHQGLRDRVARLADAIGAGRRAKLAVTVASPRNRSSS